MIRGLLYLLLSALLLQCSSCHVQDETVFHSMREGEALRFSLLQTTKGSQTGSFDRGDSIGVFATGHGDFAHLVAANVKYVWNGSHFESEHPVLYQGKPLDFYVYSPYRKSNTAIRAIGHSITSQATFSAWQASDFLTATNLSGLAEGNIPLSFQHKYATVRFGTEEIPGMAGCRLKHIRTNTSLDFLQNLAIAEGGLAEIEMLDGGLQEGVHIYEATIPVQDMQGAVFAVRINGGETIQCPVAATFLLEAGKLHHFGADLAETVVTEYEISLSPGAYTFGRDGGSYTFSISCYRVTNTYHGGLLYHTARERYDGYSTYTEGAGFSCSGATVYAARNSASSARSGRFVVTAGNAYAEAYLYQESGVEVTYGYGYEISVSPTSHTFSGEGESKTFTVTCYYCTYTYHDGALYSTDRSAYTGYSTSVSGSGFSLSGNTVTASKNKGAARQGTFEASVGNVSATASLSQEEGEEEKPQQPETGTVTLQNSYTCNSGATQVSITFQNYASSGETYTLTQPGNARVEAVKGYYKITSVSARCGNTTMNDAKVLETTTGTSSSFTVGSGQSVYVIVGK